MADILLVRQGGNLSDAEVNQLRDLTFRLFDGGTDVDRKRIRNWFGRWKRAEPGEMSTIKTAFRRSSPFHRRHMAIEQAVFDAQERITDFEQFRVWLKVGAGFVDWLAGPKGGVVPVPRSIDYARCDDETMREFHDNAIAFLRGPHAATFLWKHITPAHAEDTMNTILSEFDE